MRFIRKIDFTALSTYLSCPRKFNFIFREGFAPEPSPSAKFGTAFHQALAFYYRGLMEEQLLNKAQEKLKEPLQKALSNFLDRKKVSPNFKDDFLTSLEEISKEWADKVDLKNVLEYAKTVYPQDVDVPPRTLEKFLFLVESYIGFYLIEPLRAIWVEASFEVPLDKGHNFCGRIDLLAKDTNFDYFIVVDHKTSQLALTQLQSDFLFQLTGYAFGASKTLHTNVERVLVNYIQVTKSKSSPNDFLYRMPYYIPVTAQEDWRKLVLEWISVIERNDAFLPNPKSCVAYGRCPFYDICQFPAEKQIEELRIAFTRQPSEFYKEEEK